MNPVETNGRGPRPANEVGRVLGTENAQALEYWVGIHDDRYAELDDVLALETHVPGRGTVCFYGIVDQVRALYEGASFDSDVFRVEEGVLPVGVSNAAHVSITRVEPEIFVAPQPGLPVFRAEGHVREQALFFDQMQRRFLAGLSRDGQPVYGNLEFLDGTRGAHVNISGVSGVATKTTYALYLLYSLFHSQQAGLGAEAANTRALVFNVKGEDLLYLDKRNRKLRSEHEAEYASLGLPAGPFRSVGLWAPPHRHSPVLLPDTGSRKEGIRPYCWSLWDFCQQRLLRFLFADADNETNQLSYVVSQVERQLVEGADQVPGSGSIRLSGEHIDDFEHLVDVIERGIEGMANQAASGTRAAFIRRLHGAVGPAGHLIRGGPAGSGENAVSLDGAQLTVVDLHQLHDRAKRFVVGVLLKRVLEDKDERGTRLPLTFLVLDELNKYAPRDGWSPIGEVLLDVAERGRSLGVILVGAQQTASHVEPRVVGNASFRVVGRLDSAEALKSEYGFLTGPTRARSTILKPGSMFVLQPEIPVPLLVRFPFPSWATRSDEAEMPAAEAVPRGFER